MSVDESTQLVHFAFGHIRFFEQMLKHLRRATAEDILHEIAHHRSKYFGFADGWPPKVGQAFAGSGELPLFFHDLHDRKHARVSALFPIGHGFEHLARGRRTMSPQEGEDLEF